MRAAIIRVFSNGKKKTIFDVAQITTPVKRNCSQAEEEGFVTIFEVPRFHRYLSHISIYHKEKVEIYPPLLIIFRYGIRSANTHRKTSSTVGIVKL